MLKLIWLGISFFLIIIIFLQMPKENEGLANFVTKSNVTKSPSSSVRFFKRLTTFSIFIYLVIALYVNLSHLKGSI